MEPPSPCPALLPAFVLLVSVTVAALPQPNVVVLFVDRIQFIRLNEFRESWMPTLKAGSFRQFQLFDLSQDITQRTDVSLERPAVFKTLKQALLEIHASVMRDGPDWGATGP